MHALIAVALVGCSGEGSIEVPPDLNDPNDTDTPAEVLSVPGKTLHRLNRAEYDNTTRDLLATSFTPSSLLPPDEVTHDFDNMADALTTSSSHLTGYEAAAGRMLDEVWGRISEETIEYDPVRAVDPGVIYEGRGSLKAGAYEITEGSLTGTSTVLYDGTFEVSAQLYAVDNGMHLPVAELEIDGTPVAWFDITTDATAPELVSHQLFLDPGLHQITWRLANPAAADSSSRHSLGVKSYQITGPLDPVNGPTEAFDRLVTCDPADSGDEACAEEILDGFLFEAWRRPPTSDDLDWAMSVYDLGLSSGESWDGAVQTAMKGVLLHPAFMYRVETDPVSGETVRRLDDYELASRLSYFLWSTMPDDVLFDAAANSALAEDATVAEQTARMLADPRSDALIDNLAGQWWSLRTLEEHTPLAEAYPDFDEALRHSMQAELEFLADDFFQGRVDLDTMLGRQESWIDARLAEHYGVGWPSNDPGWALTPTTDGRRGLLGAAGWLMATSNTDAPSNVRRGKWVLANLLCSSPAPPPPDVEGSFDPQPTSGSIREQEEALRADAQCQTCHSAMDPIGFVMGNFDATGAVRTEDELGYPIDTQVDLAGVTMSSLQELTEFVAADFRLPRCVADRAFTYAMGRPPQIDDEAIMQDITTNFVDGGATFPALAEAITTSPAFVNRSNPEVAP